MKPLKTTAIILIIGAALIGIYLVKLIKKPALPAAKTENNLTEEKLEKTLFKIPTREVQNNLKETQSQKKEENQMSQPNESAPEPVQQPEISSETESKIPTISVLIGEYYKNFLDTLLKTYFTNEEFASIKKDDEGRVFLLEELIEQVVSGTNLEELKSSFAAWHQLDERILIELNKISLKPETINVHQFMTDWFKYHSDISKKLSEEDFSQNQIAQLFEEFKEKAKTHNSKFGKSLSQLKNSSDFVLIPTAQAITCGAVIPPPFYHFGGWVIPPVHFCVVPPLGIINTITPPCGGLLLFPYPVLAINPFLWKKPTIASATIGRSVILPGACLGVGISPPVYVWEAAVLYFGTTLIP